jgi:ectoine hydroxylase-related dioxygenase (phytanoyl-CoA dioxygenase family)
MVGLLADIRPQKVARVDNGDVTPERVAHTEDGNGSQVTTPQKTPRKEDVKSSQVGGFYSEDVCDIEEFKALTARKTDLSAVPFASAVEKNIPIYDCSQLQVILDNPASKRSLMTEWASIFLNGAGVVVLQKAFTDKAAIDDATKVFNDIIEEERAAGGGADHFAAKGANGRIWNAQQKLCLKAPDVFAKYWNNPFVDAINEAWLGPGYQMTSQVNLVPPGGKAQAPHRDYHLGFMTNAQASRFPAHVHCNISPQLSLQGGVAHEDCPIESGTTYLLPFSQLYRQGYVAWRRQDFKDHFFANYVQMPFQKGDCIFFNPALFHAGGDNRTTNVQRLVNLMQANSALGRAMESVDRIRMSKALFPVLSKTFAADPKGARLAIASCAEGYPFPTNLDCDPPEGGLAPLSQQDIFLKALKESWTVEAFNAAMDAQRLRQTA